MDKKRIIASARKTCHLALTGNLGTNPSCCCGVDIYEDQGHGGWVH